MIQDIYPHVYDNAYHTGTPQENDCVLLFSKSSIFLTGTREQPSLPTYGQVCGLLAQLGGEYIYLFRVDETPYYLFYSLTPFSGRLPLLKTPLSDIRSMHPAALAFICITANQLNKWYHEHRFCGKCGRKNSLSEAERAIVCKACGTTVYPKLSPVVIVGVTDGDRLLLTRYKGRPHANYALIAGFVEIGETLEEAVRREVMEEVGLHVTDIRYYDSQPWSFSDSLLAGFFVKLDGSGEITLDQKELCEARFIPREEIPQADPSISLTGTMIENFRLGIAP